MFKNQRAIQYLCPGMALAFSQNSQQLHHFEGNSGKTRIKPSQSISRRSLRLLSSRKSTQPVLQGQIRFWVLDEFARAAKGFFSPQYCLENEI